MLCDIHTHNTNPRIPSVIDVSGCVDFPFVDGSRYSAGIHPREISASDVHSRLASIREMASLGTIQAIGECGLDKFSDTASDTQFQVFAAQADIAQQFRLPIIVHCVRLYPDVVRLLKTKRFTLPLILHGYGANVETTHQLLKYQNIYFSIGKILNGKVLDSVSEIPAERLLTESDTDTGMDFGTLIGKMASAKGISADEMEAIVFENYRKIFEK